MTYRPKVAILNPAGDHVRFVHRALAGALVEAGTATPSPINGRIREIALIETAATHAQRIGPPTGAALTGTRFTRWARLDDSSARVVEHHPRCLWLEY